MIKSMLKGVMSSVVVGILDDYRRLSVQLFKAQAAKAYLHGIRTVRLLTICRIQTALVIGLILLGAILFHAGLFVLLPWSTKTKAILGMCLGTGYVACGVVFLLSVMDEKMWMEKSGAAKMLKEAVKEAERGNR